MSDELEILHDYKFCVEYEFYYSYNTTWLKTKEYFTSEDKAREKIEMLKSQRHTENIVLYRLKFELVELF